MSDEPIQTQTPGEHGATEKSALEKILEGKVPEIAASLDEASDQDLIDLAALEVAGTGRKGVHQAIELEQRRRAIERADNGEGEVIEGQSRDPAADSDYRHLRASQIDAAKLNSPVLSADGWVMPNPAAKPLA